MLRVPLHQLDADLPVPGYAREGDAGADLSRPHGGRPGPSGAAGRWCRRAWPWPSRPGTPAWCCPAAGWPLRHGVTCLNAPGLVDSGYRGELRVVLVNHDPEHDYTVVRGDRIAQLVLVRVEQAAFELVAEDGLGESERGSGGFGHTGT